MAPVLAICRGLGQIETVLDGAGKRFLGHCRLGSKLWIGGTAWGCGL
jgi:hypothetical protein